MTVSATAKVRGSKVTQRIGLVGMVCFGVVHLLIAWLGVQVAFGDSEQADQRGAVVAVAQAPLGSVLLWALAAGLIAFALWQFLLAAIGYRWVRKGGKRAFRRIGAAATGLAGTAVALFTIQLVSGNGGGGSGDQEPRELTARLLALPWGQLLVGVAAAVVVGVAIAAAVKGIRQSFMDDLDIGLLATGRRRLVRRLGTIGYCAKGVAYAVIGVLTGVAAWFSDAARTGGLDAALKTLRAQAFGPVLLVAIACGFAAFGLYCFAVARAQRL